MNIQIVSKHYLLFIELEEKSMKWMDKPSVTEMERGGVYEMDRWKSAKKNGNATELDQM